MNKSRRFIPNLMLVVGAAIFLSGAVHLVLLQRKPATQTLPPSLMGQNALLQHSLEEAKKSPAKTYQYFTNSIPAPLKN